MEQVCARGILVASSGCVPTFFHKLKVVPVHGSSLVYAHTPKMHIEPTVAGAESGNAYVLPHLTHDNVIKI